MSDSSLPHGLYSPWNPPGQNTVVGRLSPSPWDLPNPGIKPRPDARVMQEEQERGHRRAFWQPGEVGSSHYIIFNYYLLTSLTRSHHLTD